MQYTLDTREMESSGADTEREGSPMVETAELSISPEYVGSGKLIFLALITIVNLIIMTHRAPWRRDVSYAGAEATG